MQDPDTASRPSYPCPQLKSWRRHQLWDTGVRVPLSTSNFLTLLCVILKLFSLSFVQRKKDILAGLDTLGYIDALLISLD